MNSHELPELELIPDTPEQAFLRAVKIIDARIEFNRTIHEQLTSQEEEARIEFVQYFVGLTANQELLEIFDCLSKRESEAEIYQRILDTVTSEEGIERQIDLLYEKSRYHRFLHQEFFKKINNKHMQVLQREALSEAPYFEEIIELLKPYISQAQKDFEKNGPLTKFNQDTITANYEVDFRNTYFPELIRRLKLIRSKVQGDNHESARNLDNLALEAIKLIENRLKIYTSFFAIFELRKINMRFSDAEAKLYLSLQQISKSDIESELAIFSNVDITDYAREHCYRAQEIYQPVANAYKSYLEDKYNRPRSTSSRDNEDDDNDPSVSQFEHVEDVGDIGKVTTTTTTTSKAPAVSSTNLAADSSTQAVTTPTPTPTPVTTTISEDAVKPAAPITTSVTSTSTTSSQMVSTTTAANTTANTTKTSGSERRDRVPQHLIDSFAASQPVSTFQYKPYQKTRAGSGSDSDTGEPGGEHTTADPRITILRKKLRNRESDLRVLFEENIHNRLREDSLIALVEAAGGRVVSPGKTSGSRRRIEFQNSFTDTLLSPDEIPEEVQPGSNKKKRRRKRKQNLKITQSYHTKNTRKVPGAIAGHFRTAFKKLFNELDIDSIDTLFPKRVNECSNATPKKRII